MRSSDEKIRILQESCPGIDCAGDTCKTNCLRLHEIDPGTFDYVVEAYFGKRPTYKTVYKYDMIRLIGIHTCRDKYIEFKGPETVDNDDLEYSILDVPPTKEFISHYSITLFQAILDRYDPDKFEFSKAITIMPGPTPTIEKTVVFRVIKGGNIPYHGDLSSQWYP